MTNPHQTLFPDDPDPLARWRADIARREEEFAAEQRREERAASGQVESLRAEIAALRNYMSEREQANSENMVEIARAVREVVDQIPDWIKAAVAESDAELRG